MKKLTSPAAPVTARDRAMKAIADFLNHPTQPQGFTMQEEVICLMGGADGCLTRNYDYRDTIQAITDFISDKKKDFPIYHETALDFLKNAFEFFDVIIRDENLQAEIVQDVLDLYGDGEVDEYYDNLTKQYELKAQLLALKAEEHEIGRRSREKKAA